MRRAPIDVAVTIVRNAQGEVLLAQRTATQIAPGYWELPGGKVDPGETPLEAAARELAEEVGLKALRLRPWMQYVHHYQTASVRLHFAVADVWSGTAHGREGQQVAWVDPTAPAVAPLLPSNLRVLAALGLPPIYGTSDGLGLDGYEAIASAVRAGLRLLQLREPDHAPDQRVILARRASSLLVAVGGRATLSGSALEARRAGLNALHTSAADLQRLHARPQVALWIASCHGAPDLERASRLGADAAVLSPVHRTDTHPDRVPLGWDGIARLTASARLPIYCAGGLTPTDLPRARAAGAIGICSRLTALARPPP